jgi:DNA-binding NarL/FixJ family response regulator
MSATTDNNERAADVETSGGGPGLASALPRLVIVADSSLIVEAIHIGVRRSGEFNLVGHADGRKTSARTLLGTQPDVILLDDMDQSGRVTELIGEIRSQDQRVNLIVLSLAMDPVWLDTVFGAGATAVISKATHPAALARLVRETLNGHVFHRHAPVLGAIGQAPAGAGAGDLPLTGRESEILRLVASGSTNGDVARRLWVTEQTVKFHLRNIYRKLGVANRTQASRYAHVNGLVAGTTADRSASSSADLAVAAS